MIECLYAVSTSRRIVREIVEYGETYYAFYVTFPRVCKRDSNCAFILHSMCYGLFDRCDH
jgi:hypothetical protein